jgi:lipid-binding SYLF domain-containing protein
MFRKSLALHLLAGLIAVLPLAAQAQAQAQEKAEPQAKKASPAELRTQLHTSVEGTVAQFKKTDAGFDKVLADAAGYAVFPKVGKGGFIVAAGHGDGELIEKGKAVGTTSVTMGSIGLTAGVQEYSQIIVFKDQAALDRFKQNKFEWAANASAVMIKSGAAVAAKYPQGAAAFIHPTAGVMAEASVGGQKFNFKADGAPAKK